VIWGPVNDGPLIRGLHGLGTSTVQGHLYR